jgi:DNA-binding GntR family transcriptional regulator
VAPELAPIELERPSTADQVAESLRARILDGDLRPGDRITEASVARSTDVSRNTIREALRTLAREGLVTHRRYRGATVTQLTVHDVRDIFRLRRTLESAAVDASRNATESELAALEEATSRFEAGSRARDWRRILASDFEFHRRLVALLRSRRLDVAFEDALLELRLCFVLASRYDSPDLMSAQHRAICDAVVSGDVAGAHAIVAEHMEEAEELMLAIARDSTREESVATA